MRYAAEIAKAIASCSARIAPCFAAGAGRHEGTRVTTAHLNRIATAVPPHDIHAAFQQFGASLLQDDREAALLFRRMSRRSGIEHRYSSLSPGAYPEAGSVDGEGFYRRGNFPNTRVRMQRFEQDAPVLAQKAVEHLLPNGERGRITHLLITSCTGMSAPGLDFEIIDRCGLPKSTERTLIGFMGCYAAVNGLKLARHIVRSDPAARVLALNIELCTLHLNETNNIEQILTFLLFGDGCAASLITAEPTGAALEAFRAIRSPGTSELMTWKIGDSGFDMRLSGQVPGEIQSALHAHAADIVDAWPRNSIDLWAVHPGGRTVLEAVERGLDLRSGSLADSRDILKNYGNMSSATVIFVLQKMLRSASAGQKGCAMSFGPGLVAETMTFHIAG
jgi:alpha-pyrone synthase